MKNGMKKMAASALLCASMLGTSAVAFADAAMDFTVTSGSINGNGKVQAVGKITNTGDKNIEKVNKVFIVLKTANASGAVTTVGEHEFADITVHLAPGQSTDVSLEFTGAAAEIPADAVEWTAEEDRWEFTYFEDAPAPAAEAVDAAAVEAAVTELVEAVQQLAEAVEAVAAE